MDYFKDFFASLFISFHNRSILLWTFSKVVVVLFMVFFNQFNDLLINVHFFVGFSSLKLSVVFYVKKAVMAVENLDFICMAIEKMSFRLAKV